MNKISMQLFLVSCSFFGLLVVCPFVSNTFASSYADDSWRPRLILTHNIKGFFGDLKGTFRFDQTKLYRQILSGLEDDEISDQQVVQLPQVRKGLYLETGSTENYYPLFSAVVINSSDKVFSAALLDSAGLAIFLRSSAGNSVYIATFKKWAQVLWCSQSPLYVGLGSTAKLNQKYDRSLVLSECRRLNVKIIYLSGYGNKSVN